MRLCKKLLLTILMISLLTSITYAEDDGKIHYATMNISSESVSPSFQYSELVTGEDISPGEQFIVSSNVRSHNTGTNLFHMELEAEPGFIFTSFTNMRGDESHTSTQERIGWETTIRRDNDYWFRYGVESTSNERYHITGSTREFESDNESLVIKKYMLGERIDKRSELDISIFVDIEEDESIRSTIRLENIGEVELRDLRLDHPVIQYSSLDDFSVAKDGEGRISIRSIDKGETIEIELFSHTFIDNITESIDVQTQYYEEDLSTNMNIDISDNRIDRTGENIKNIIYSVGVIAGLAFIIKYLINLNHIKNKENKELSVAIMLAMDWTLDSLKKRTKRMLSLTKHVIKYSIEKIKSFKKKKSKKE